MALEGTFKDFHVADIVQLIGLQRKTGVLTLEGESETLNVTFQDGEVVWAQSSRGPWERRMVHLLEVRDLVTPAQLQESLAVQKETRRSLSTILVKKGALQREDWDSILAREVEEAIYRPFLWITGRYRFVPGSADLSEGKIGPLGAESVLMEGIHRVDKWPFILEKIPSTAMVFKVGSRYVKLNPKQVEPHEVMILDLVDGKHTVQELVDKCGLGDFEAMRGLASLVDAGAIASVGLVAVEEPAKAVADSLSTHFPWVPAGPPRWVARVGWGMATLWLLASLVFFQIEPLGLVPLSEVRTKALDRVRSLRAQAELAELARSLEEYVASTGESPSSVNAMGRPVRDPWGHPYYIRRTTSGVVVVSAGPDGRIGTADDLADGN